MNTDIRDKNGELLSINIWKMIGKFIKENTGLVAFFLPIIFGLVTWIFKFVTYIYLKGIASVYNISNEMILINYTVSLYKIIISGGIFLGYWLYTVFTAKIWFNRGTSVKEQLKAYTLIIVLVLLIPIIIVLGLYAILVQDLSAVFFEIRESPWEMIYLILYILTLNGLLVTALGRVGLSFLYENEKKSHNNGKLKKKGKVKHKWKRKDYQIIGMMMIVFLIVCNNLYLYRYSYNEEIQRAKYDITSIDGQNYIIVMNNGEEVVLVQCDLRNNDKELIIEKKYLKTESTNLLIQSYHFEPQNIKRN